VSPNLDSTWVAALAPEIGLTILLVLVLAYDRFLKPEDRRRVGMMTAWGAFITLLVVLGLWLFFDMPNSQWTLNESQMWGGMIRFDMVSLVFTVIFLSALGLTSLLAMDVPYLQRSEF
jgi:NADH:ubiquinone oxidoreductase subunit 2 (subunit N)